jgi:hypothetical protein
MRRCAIGFLTILSTVQLALANGGFKPLIEYPQAPTIPVQRALITYRDGVETLIVESTYQTASPEVAWILPLPAEPTKLEKADPGLLETLSIQVQPKVISSSGLAWIIIVGMILLAFPLVGIRLMAGEPLSVYAVIAIALIAWFGGAICLMPSLERARAGGGPEEEASGVNILNSQRVGNYDVQVLRADSSTALADFLAAGKLQPLSAEEKKIFDGYISEGWCFLVSTLHRDSSNLPATPHPIAATFPTKSIVFPMRATKIANTKTHVELFVAADTRTTADGFTTVAAQRLFAESLYSRTPSTYFDGHFSMSPRYVFVAHPDLKDLLWNRCVLTKLTADLPPSRMDNDVAILRMPYAPSMQEVYSNGVRNDWIGATLCIAVTGMLAFLAVASKPLRRLRRMPRAQRISLLSIPLAVALGIYYFFPSIPTTIRPHIRSENWLGPLHTAISRCGGELDATLADSPEKLLEIFHRHEQDAALVNPFTGAPIAVRRSPGNYQIIRETGGARLIFYNSQMFPREITFLHPPATAPATTAVTAGNLR